MANRQKRKTSVHGLNYIRHLIGDGGYTLCRRRVVAVNCVGPGDERDAKDAEDVCEVCRKKWLAGAVDRLAAATAETLRSYPLPRCEHGQALRDHGYEALEPPCGCRWQP